MDQAAEDVHEQAALLPVAALVISACRVLGVSGRAREGMLAGWQKKCKNTFTVLLHHFPFSIFFSPKPTP